MESPGAAEATPIASRNIILLLHVVQPNQYGLS
jgi:hypothetical protein